MKNFIRGVGLLFIGVLIGIGIGYWAAWKEGEPDRLAVKEAKYFRIEMQSIAGESDRLVEKLCDVVEELEKNFKIGPKVYVKLSGKDRAVALMDLAEKPKPSAAD